MLKLSFSVAVALVRIKEEKRLATLFTNTCTVCLFGKAGLSVCVCTLCIMSNIL